MQQLVTQPPVEVLLVGALAALPEGYPTTTTLPR